MVSACRVGTLVIGSVLAGVSPVSGGSIGFFDLGTLSGPSAAWAVSADGRVVVGDSGGHAFAWSESTGMVGLGGTSARGVSADGSVICGYTGAGGSSLRSVRWTGWNPAAMQDLNTFGDGSYSVALGMSSDGSVIVGNAFNGNYSLPDTVAYRWTAGGEITSLGATWATGPLGGAQAITPDGTVVVGNNDVAGPIARRWSSGIQTTLVPFGHASAEAVSSDGNIVVGWSGSPGSSTAFIWNHGILEDLPSVTGASGSAAAGISADGQLVVGSAMMPAGSRAVLWDAQTGGSDLQGYLESRGVPGLSGWQLTNATGVSADGSVIVGYGMYMGTQRAWMATVPAPCSILPLFAFAARRRRQPPKAFL